MIISPYTVGKTQVDYRFKLGTKYDGTGGNCRDHSMYQFKLLHNHRRSI